MLERLDFFAHPDCAHAVIWRRQYVRRQYVIRRAAIASMCRSDLSARVHWRRSVFTRGGSPAARATPIGSQARRAGHRGRGPRRSRQRRQMRQAKSSLMRRWRRHREPHQRRLRRLSDRSSGAGSWQNPTSARAYLGDDRHGRSRDHLRAPRTLGEESVLRTDSSPRVAPSALGEEHRGLCQRVAGQVGVLLRRGG